MDFVKYKEEEYTALITISRPQALNALNSQVLKELSECIDSIDPDRVRVLVITGEGDRSFVAGADIREMLEMDAETSRVFTKTGNDMFRKIETLPIPVIAAVNGFALGGGCELAMSCDIRYCSENAVFGQPEVGLGITPGFGGTVRLARLIGPGKAKEMLFTGQNIKAEEAYRVGLVNKVCPPEELMSEVMKLANKIASNAPIAVRNAKKSVNEGLDTDTDSALEKEERLFGECFSTEDQKEGMTAFLEKRRKVNFINR